MANKKQIPKLVAPQLKRADALHPLRKSREQFEAEGRAFYAEVLAKPEHERTDEEKADLALFEQEVLQQPTQADLDEAADREIAVAKLKYNEYNNPK